MYEGYRYDTYALADSVVLVYCIFVFGCPVQKDIIMTMVPAFNEAFKLSYGEVVFNFHSSSDAYDSIWLACMRMLHLSLFMIHGLRPCL